MEGLNKVINTYFDGMANIIQIMGDMPWLIPVLILLLFLYCMPIVLVGGAIVGAIGWIADTVRN